MKQEFHINKPEEIKQVVDCIRQDFPEKRLILLHGDLGAGKTTFVQGFAEILHVVDDVTSPTFSIINEYRTRRGDPCYHIDLYRLDTIEEAINVGVEEYLYTPYYCFIEWPELIEPLIPANSLKIHIELLNKSMRKVVIL